MTRRLLLAAVVLLAASLAAAAPKPDPEPRPLSSVESAAVEIAAKFLQGGAGAIWDDLAASSPLRQVGREAASREIAARLGPHRDVSWSLQTVGRSLQDKAASFEVVYPSGLADTMVFEMIDDGGAWRLAMIRSQGEPAPPLAALPPPAREVASKLEGRLDTASSFALALPALLLAIVALALRETRRVAAAVAAAFASAGVLAAALIALVLAFPSLMPSEAPLPPSTGSVPHFVSMAGLVPMREAIASGDIGRARQLYAQLPAGDARDVAMLWKLQFEQRDERSGAVHREVPRLRWRAHTPLAHLLLARAAFFEDDVTEAILAYEAAMSTGVSRDGMLLEAATSLAAIGEEHRAALYFDRAAELGSREPSLYYFASVLHAMLGDEEGASKTFLQAWNMRPVPRGDALAMAVLWHVFRQPQVAAALQLSRAEEATFSAERHHPIRVPTGVEAEVSGDHLLLRTAHSQLDVPGGGTVAPEAATIVDARAWERREQAELLAEFDRTRVQAANAGAIVDPQFRERLVATGQALAAQNRWQDLLALTSSLPPRDEKVPVELMVLRGHAFSRTKRPAELRTLIVDLLRNPAVKNRENPEPLIAIAELLVAADLNDAAIAMYARVLKEASLPAIERRLLQLRIEQALSKHYDVLATEHFDIVFPPELPKELAEKAGDILEREYVRLRNEWLPGTTLKRTRVNLLWWDDFATYAGSEYIAGLFTDEIFLPMAGVTRFEPEVVEVMTHELFHAMLAGATGDLAPRWFQEAFASRIEMAESKPNAFHLYRNDRFISIAMLDEVAKKSPDLDLVRAVYVIGEATIRYIETKWGRGGLRRLVDEFGRGATTEAAVQNALGISVAELDRQARAWGLAQPPSFTGRVIRYDEQKLGTGKVKIVL